MQFKQIAEEIVALYEKKNKAYGNSFSATYEKLGLVSAVTRISDKYNRLCNLATNKDIDDLGESIEDTLKDMAAYCIMTLMELRHPLVKALSAEAILESVEGWTYVGRILGKERAIKLIENGTSLEVALDMTKVIKEEFKPVNFNE